MSDVQAGTGPRMMQCVIFILDEQQYAVRLSAVSRVVRAVEVTLLPDAPSIVMGIINLRGRIIPVVNVRRRFRFPERDLLLTDQMIVAWTTRRGAQEDTGRLLALAVDAVQGVRDLSEKETSSAESIVPGLYHLEGVAKTGQGLVLIHDLGTFLSLEEEGALDAILPEGNR